MRLVSGEWSSEHSHTSSCRSPCTWYEVSMGGRVVVSVSEESVVESIGGGWDISTGRVTTQDPLNYIKTNVHVVNMYVFILYMYI